MSPTSLGSRRCCVLLLAAPAATFLADELLADESASDSYSLLLDDTTLAAGTLAFLIGQVSGGAGAGFCFPSTELFFSATALPAGRLHGWAFLLTTAASGCGALAFSSTFFAATFGADAAGGVFVVFGASA